MTALVLLETGLRSDGFPGLELETILVAFNAGSREFEGPRPSARSPNLYSPAQEVIVWCRYVAGKFSQIKRP